MERKDIELLNEMHSEILAAASHLLKVQTSKIPYLSQKDYVLEGVLNVMKNSITESLKTISNMMASGYTAAQDTPVSEFKLDAEPENSEPDFNFDFEGDMNTLYSEYQSLVFDYLEGIGFEDFETPCHAENSAFWEDLESYLNCKGIYTYSSDSRFEIFVNKPEVESQDVEG